MPGNNREDTRQERREKKLKSKRERIVKHGKSLAQMYRDAISRRLGKKQDS
jgi:hypothetical protein